MIFYSLCILPFCFVFHLAQNLVREKRSSNHNTRYEAWLFRDGIHKYSKIYQNFRVVNVKKFYIDLASFGLDVSSPLWEWLDKVKVWAGRQQCSVSAGVLAPLFLLHHPQWIALMCMVQNGLPPCSLFQKHEGGRRREMGGLPFPFRKQCGSTELSMWPY